MSLTITAPREVVLSFFKLVATVCLFPFSAQTLEAQQPRENPQTKYVIERLDLIGNRRAETDTLFARISSRPGDPYSVEAVRRDVQALLNDPLRRCGGTMASMASSFSVGSARV
jgi:outer membrane protein assembly factor BamA